MKTRELIKHLLGLDPDGDMRVLAWDEENLGPWMASDIEHNDVARYHVSPRNEITKDPNDDKAICIG